MDILEIDRKITEYFQKEQELLPGYKKKLEDLTKTLISNGISLGMKNELTITCEKLQETISRIESEQELNFYIAETEEILCTYKELLKTPVKISFMGRQQGESKEKLELIKAYMNKVKKYYTIFSVETPVKKSSKLQKEEKILECNNCKNKHDLIIEDSFYTCVQCGSQQELLQYTTSYKDVDRINVSSKYTYDRKVHFRDCMNQYQGKQNCTVDQKVYDELINAFERHHLLLDIKQGEDEKLRFENITKEHVTMFLKELGYSKHYENVILIHYNITGKKPDDISHLEDVLLSDFDLLVETYDKEFKNKPNSGLSRVNFISTHYVLYQLLRKHKHPCRREDFTILKTVDRQSFHDTVYGKLAEILEWPFFPLYG